MRIALDTNVLIAAFISRGVCRELLAHCIGQHELVTSEFILNEFHRNLSDKFRYSIEESAEAVESLRLAMDVVTPAILENPVSRDSDDGPVLGTAIAGNADCIITGDKDLLVLKRFGVVDIVSPSEFPGYEAARQEGV